MKDLNECASGENNCSSIATCLNTNGSYTCTCPSGYDGDGTFCTGIEKEEKETKKRKRRKEAKKNMRE